MSVQDGNDTRPPAENADDSTRPFDNEIMSGHGVDWNLRLYVAGETPKSIAAITNLKRICDKHLAGRCTIEVIDLLKHPQLAAGDQILAVPTLVRRLPPPLKRIIGDLSSTERVLVGLDVRSRGDSQ